MHVRLLNQRMGVWESLATDCRPHPAVTRRRLFEFISLDIGWTRSPFNPILGSVSGFAISLLETGLIPRETL